MDVLHYISFRVAVPTSTICQGRPNGAFPHNDPDLGDPRCTFVVCSNARPVIQGCPRGTRTTFNLHSGPFSHFFSLLKHDQRGVEHGLRQPAYKLAPPGGAATSVKNGKTSTPSAGPTLNQSDSPNQVGRGDLRMFLSSRNLQLYSPLYFNHKMCNIHDIHGVCGDPFPDLNAYSNIVPRTDVIAPQGDAP